MSADTPSFGYYSCPDCGYESDLILLPKGGIFVHSCLLRAERVLRETEEAMMKKLDLSWKKLERRSGEK